MSDIQRKNFDDLVGSTSVKRGSYAKYPTDLKLKITKYATENGVIAALRKHCRFYPELKESTIKGILYKVVDARVPMTIDTMIITTHASRDQYLFDFYKIRFAKYYKTMNLENFNPRN